MPKLYRLLGADGVEYESPTPGTLGGYTKLHIYGRLDCASAIRSLPRGYARHRVFFADEATAIAAGYRPCGKCMREGHSRDRHMVTACGEPGRAYPPQDRPQSALRGKASRGSSTPETGRNPTRVWRRELVPAAAQ